MFLRVFRLFWLVCLPVAALAQDDAQEERDVGFLAGLIEDNLSGVSRQVQINGFEGALSSEATVEELLILDREGVWLRATGLTLDWNRSALLRGAIDVEELSAETLEVLRAPIADATVPSAEATPFSLPELPVSIQVDDFRIDEITLGEPILGEEIVINLTGQASLEGGEGSAAVVAQRLDRDGRFEISGAYSNESRILDLTLDLTEPEGGLVASALGLPGEPALALQLDGTGPIDDYEAQISLATNGEPRVSGTFEIARAGGEAEGPEGAPPATEVALNLEGDLAPLLPETYRPFVGDQALLRLRASRQAGGETRVPELVLRTDALSIEGEAVIGPDNWPVRLMLDGSLGGGEGGVVVPGGTDVGSATLQLSYDAAESEDFTFVVEANDVDRDGLALDLLQLSAIGAISPPQGDTPGALDVELDFSAEGLELADPGLAQALGSQIAGHVEIARDGGPVQLNELSLTGPGLELSGEGEVQGADERFLTRLDLDLVSDDLTRFADLAGTDLSGAASLMVGLSARPLDGAFEIALAGETRELALGIENVDPLLAGTGTIDLAADRDETGTRLTRLNIETPALSLTADADLTSAASDARFDFQIPDLSVAVPGLTGGANLSGEASRGADGAGRLVVEGSVPNGNVDITATQEATDLGGRITYEGTIAVSDLDPYAELAGRDLGGALQAAFDGSAAPDFGTFQVALSALANDLSVGLPDIDPLLAGGVRFQGRVLRLGPENFRVEGLDLSSPFLFARGSGSYDFGTVQTDGLSVTVTDLAPLSGLAGRDLAGELDADASGQLQTDLSTFDLTVDARADDISTGISQIDPLLDGTVTLQGRAVRTGPQEGSLQDFVLNSPLVDATGAVTVEGGVIETPGLSVEISDLAPFSALAGRTLGGSVTAQADGTAALDLSVLDLTLDAAAEDLRVGIPGIDPILRGRIEFDAAAERTGPDSYAVRQLSLTSPLIDAGGSVVVEDGIATTDGLTLSVTDLGPFSVLAGTPLAGTVEAQLSGSAAIDAATFDLSLEASARDFAAGVPEYGELLSGDINLSAEAERTGPLDFALTGLSLTSPLVNASGEIAVEDGIARTDGLSLQVDDLAPFSGIAGRPLTGSVTAEASGLAAIDASSFDLTLDTRTNGLSLGLPQVDPLLRGEVTLSGTAERTGPMDFAVSDLSLRAPAISASGDATLTDGVVSTPGFDLVVPDLGPFSGLAGRTLGGTVGLQASGDLATDLSSFDLTLQGRTSDLRVGIDTIDGLLAGDGRINGRIARTGPLDFTAEDVAISTPALGLTLDGSLQEGLGDGMFDLRLTNTALIAPGLSGGARLAGTIGRVGEGQLSVDVEGTGPGGLDLAVDALLDPLDPENPALWQAEGSVRLAASNLGAYQGLIGRPLGGAVDARLEGRLRTDLSTFDLMVDAQASGLDVGVPAVAQVLAGTGTLSGRAIRDGDAIQVQNLVVDFPNLDVSADLTARPGGTGQATFDARLADLGLFVPDFPGPLTAQGSASLDPSGQWNVNATVTGPSDVQAQIGGAVLPGGNLALNVTGTAPLGIANQFIEPQRLEGLASFDLSIDGPPALSSVTGTISASNGRLALPALGPAGGQAIENISATVTLNGQAAQIQVNAALPSGGTISVSGPVGLSAPYSGDLTIALNGAVIRDPSLFEATVNGRLSVTGPLTGGALIAGRLVIDRAEVRVPLGLGSLGDLPEVQHVGAPADVQRTLARADLTLNGTPVGQDGDGGGGGGPGYRLDVTIDAPGQIFVRGRGLDAELGGSLTLQGTTNDIIPAGQFDLIRGRLDILQQRFELDEGSITLLGDFSPALRLVAQTEAPDGTEVRIILEGEVSDLQVTFESSPQFPQDEVLARLLFGRDVSSLSPLQAVQLAAAVSTLVSGNEGVLDRFRSGLGLDDLDVTTDESGGLAVRAGRYLSENVYTDVTVGEGGTELSINLDLTEDLTVRGAVSSEGESSLGIFFERDY
ncbi:translocation/assembly module TamB domain-containing protein [Wenxinia marina]|uniref:translocation/assembly module TamB domain-containing protein n=1 Tax=Wenxinia marina TaxID=390641 RepID=UPI00037C4261|nr:translocation/assembly module TamB domain-containing protein [Wenxinia marina]